MATPILGPAEISLEQAQRWAIARDGTGEFVIDVLPLFWVYAPERGIRPEVAAAQSAKETGFGRFGGVINASYHNTCGLKTTSGGGNNDPEAHMRFPNWHMGAVAHLDHLAIYAGAPGYPRAFKVDGTRLMLTPDPRHFEWIAGKAPTVEELGGAWAPSDSYGTSIVTQYLTPMYGF